MKKMLALIWFLLMSFGINAYAKNNTLDPLYMIDFPAEMHFKYRIDDITPDQNEDKIPHALKEELSKLDKTRDEKGALKRYALIVKKYPQNSIVYTRIPFFSWMQDFFQSTNAKKRRSILNNVQAWVEAIQPYFDKGKLYFEKEMFDKTQGQFFKDYLVFKFRLDEFNIIKSLINKFKHSNITHQDIKVFAYYDDLFLKLVSEENI